ncbi:unnamed protein product, partial [Mesorhabditis belari]|uniref:Uncharacterized protein n=1 Tax=Mesorhabditis belari TaxID=2138241 RepID=A0AAF3EQF4_9BILA
MDSYKQTIWIYTVGGLGILLNLLLLYMIATDRAKGGDGRFTTLFDRWYGILALTIAHFAGGILYGLSCDFTMKPTPEREMISRDELLFRYNVSIDNLGYIGPVYKLIDETTGESKFLITNMLGSFGCCVMQLTIYWTICAAGMKLYFFVHSALISDKAKAVNFQLLRLLLIQALAPLIFEYIPAMMTIWGGFLGLPLENCAMYIPVLIACYSPTEAIMVIFGFANERV